MREAARRRHAESALGSAGQSQVVIARGRRAGAAPVRSAACSGRIRLCNSTVAGPGVQQRDRVVFLDHAGEVRVMALDDDRPSGEVPLPDVLAGLHVVEAEDLPPCGSSSCTSSRRPSVRIAVGIQPAEFGHRDRHAVLGPQGADGRRACVGRRLRRRRRARRRRTIVLASTRRTSSRGRSAVGPARVGSSATSPSRVIRMTYDGDTRPTPPSFSLRLSAIGDLTRRPSWSSRLIPSLIALVVTMPWSLP